MEWILQLPVLFFSVVVHEFCHGWAAYRRGDDTAEREGRLTLNPAAHIDPFGTVFLPLLCFFTQSPMFGWAKPVPVNETQLRDPAKDSVRVALIGPVANLALALAAAVMFKVTTLLPVPGGYRETALQMLLFAVTINLFLAFFNLLPVHPLDGSKVLGGVLPNRLRALYWRHVPYSLFIILALLLSRALATVVGWPLSLVMAVFEGVGLLS